MKNDVWTPSRMLEVWGLRVSGGSLKTPYKVSGGGESGLDDEWQAKSYMERVPGFDLARPVLVWVYAEGRDASDFPLRRPGESFASALKRLGWGDYLMVGSARVALEVLRDFEVELHEALAERPFVAVRVSSEEP